MRKLSGLDATFLNLDTPTSHLHVAGAYLYEPPTPGWGTREIFDVLANRLHLMAPLRWRLVEPPFGLGRARWIEDPDFDLAHHVTATSLDPPGSLEQFAREAADFVGRPLPRSRPLWEMRVVHGLAEGRVGVLSKSHHAAVDGVSGAELTTRLLDLTEETVVHPPPEKAWHPDEPPSESQLLRDAMVDLAVLPGRLVDRLGDLAQGSDRKGGGGGGGAFRGPRMHWNAPISPERRVALWDAPLEDLKRVRRGLGGTVNDVVLASCTSALRAYLHERAELPEEPLVALVPVSVRAPGEAGEMGNRVTQRLCPLPVHLEDPLVRYSAVLEASERAKQGEPGDLGSWLELLTPALVVPVARLYQRLGVSRHHRPVFNLTVSNVPGPQMPLFLAGARLRAWYPLGPIYEGIGLNITVLSYDGRVFAGVVGCAALLDDLDALAAHLAPALDELLTLAGP